MRRDVTNCPRVYSEDRGVNTKEWIEVDNREALFKETQIKDNGETTYADYAEGIVSDLCALLDIPCAEVELVERDGKLGCLSYSFCDNIDMILEAIESVCSSKREFAAARKALLKDILLDSLVDHYDRNPSNLSMIRDRNGIYLSPKYDNGTSNESKIAELQAQVDELSVYKQNQAQFEIEKEKYYEEVVFSDKAPDIKEYKTYYESIDPANAEVLYKQVVEQTAKDEKLANYVSTYSSMKPQQEARANILGKMDKDTAAKITQMLKP